MVPLLKVKDLIVRYKYEIKFFTHTLSPIILIIGQQPGQGQQQQQGQGPPPGVDQQLWSWFKAVDTDGSGQLSADELQRALINGDWSPFNIETVRLMVNMFDAGKVFFFSFFFFP